MVIFNAELIDPNNYGIAFVEEIFSRQLQMLPLHTLSKAI